MRPGGLTSSVLSACTSGSTTAASCAWGISFTCFTGTKVQILTLEVGHRYEMYRNLTAGTRVQDKKIKELITRCLRDPGPGIIIADEGHLLRNHNSNVILYIYIHIHTYIHAHIHIHIHIQREREREKRERHTHKSQRQREREVSKAVAVVKTKWRIVLTASL